MHTCERHSSAWISAATEPCGGSTALNSLPCFTRLFAIDTTILPCEPIGVLVHGRDRRVGVHREDHDRRVARPRVVARMQVRDPVAPLSCSSSATRCFALSTAREPNSTSCPTLASRAARPLPAGPVAPKIPIRIGERTETRTANRPDDRACVSGRPTSARHDAQRAATDHRPSRRLTVHAMQSAPKRMRSSAKRPLRASQRNSSPRRSIGLLVGADEAHEHRAVAGVRGEELAQPLHPLVGEHAGLHPQRERRRAVDVDLGPRDLHRHELRRVVAAVDAGLASSTIASASSSSPYCSIVFGNTITSIDGREVFEHERGHEVAALGVLALQPGDDARDRAHRTVVELGEIGDRALDEAAQHVLGAHQRVVAHVEAEHLLLGAQPLGLVELDVGDREPIVEHRAVVGRRRRPGRRGSSCPASRSRRRRSVASTIGSNTCSRPLRGWPSESKPPALINDSIVRLLSTLGSTRSQKS